MAKLISAGSRNISWNVMAVFTAMSVLCGCAMRRSSAPEYFTREENRLSSLIQNTQDPDWLSDWHVRRAKLRIRADNPDPDYNGALKDFTTSLELNPDLPGHWECRDWITVLDKLEQLEQRSTRLESQNQAISHKLTHIERMSLSLKSQYKKAQRQNTSLKSILNRLEKHDRDLKTSIEELQTLELRMEQRRQELR
jgi:hypothetical protein